MYYLAYGSNLNKAQMALRCPGAEAIGTGEIKGYELLFKGSLTGAYLTIEKKKDGVVPVAVWRVNQRHEKSLDRYEGYPEFYYKKQIALPIETAKGQKEVDAFVYIMHEYRNIGIPSDYYVDVCAEGYRDFGFDRRYLDSAVNRSVRRARFLYKKEGNDEVSGLWERV